MNNVILTIILSILIVQTAVFLLLVAKIRAIFHEFLSFLTQESPDKPSPAAQVWDSMCSILIEKFKFTLMGIASVEAKQAKRLEGEIATASAVEKNPLLGLAMTMFPTLRKAATKHSFLLDLALKKAAQVGGNHGPSGESPGDFASRLSKYG